MPPVPPPRAALKICGVTCAEDLELCRQHRVDAIGLNLWPGSPRALRLEDAGALVERARRPSDSPPPQLVGVVVDPPVDGLRRALDRLALDAIQLHGDAPVAPYAALGVPYVWVVRGTPDLAALRVPAPAPAWILLDARVQGFGGQGVTTDWSWAAEAVEALAPVPVWLAGGITPDNAAEALRRVAPAGLDVASGSEARGDPRRKDPVKIAALAAICQNRLVP